VDVEAFELMTQRMHMLEAIAKGERNFSRNETLTQQEAKQKLSKWLT